MTNESLIEASFPRIVQIEFQALLVVMGGAFQRQVRPPPLVDPVRRLEVRRRAAVHRQDGGREQVQRLASTRRADAQQQVLHRVPRRHPPHGARADVLHLLPVVEVPHVLGADRVPRVDEHVGHPPRQRREGVVASAAAAMVQEGGRGGGDEAVGDADALPHPPVADPLHRRRRERRVEEERGEGDARPGHGLGGERRDGGAQGVAGQPDAVVMLMPRRGHDGVDGPHGGVEAGGAVEAVADELEVERQVPGRRGLLGDGAAERDDVVRRAGSGGGGGVEEVPRRLERVDGAEDGGVGGVHEHLSYLEVEEPPPRRRAGVVAVPVPLPVALHDVHALDEARHDGSLVVRAIPGRRKTIRTQSTLLNNTNSKILKRLSNIPLWISHYFRNSSISRR
ncbi:Os01g0719800 [Oryza sativa Japonica Group]|uniref:Os01g0719800 protein n=2 Tax=Oryza sativa subsp. japonica TaxID=39947 RepID=Q0JJS7_ORYSJ|nr:Os01g0719800 [Oryza sativa Japonica Group]BAS74067.1 Os01g0719800 [Oryza sativa Japonica Group]|eukprot:NP_001044087.1 Os01g0719800 [Oryza sativa Japonica Group]